MSAFLGAGRGAGRAGSEAAGARHARGSEAAGARYARGSEAAGARRAAARLPGCEAASQMLFLGYFWDFDPVSTPI